MFQGRRGTNPRPIKPRGAPCKKKRGRPKSPERLKRNPELGKSPRKRVKTEKKARKKGQKMEEKVMPGVIGHSLV